MSKYLSSPSSTALPRYLLYVSKVLIHQVVEAKNNTSNKNLYSEIRSRERVRLEECNVPVISFWNVGNMTDSIFFFALMRRFASSKRLMNPSSRMISPAARRTRWESGLTLWSTFVTNQLNRLLMSKLSLTSIAMILFRSKSNRSDEYVWDFRKYLLRVITYRQCILC